MAIEAVRVQASATAHPLVEAAREAEVDPPAEIRLVGEYQHLKAPAPEAPPVTISRAVPDEEASRAGSPELVPLSIEVRDVTGDES